MAPLAVIAIVLAALMIKWSAVTLLRHRREARRRAIEAAYLGHLGELANVLAREIRQSLETVREFTEIACERTDPCTTRMLRPVLDEVGRLDSLARELLLYGRPPEPNYRVVTWNEISDALRAFTSDDRLQFHPKESSMTFCTDPDLLTQALSHLIGNGLEAIGGSPDGIVRVTAVQDRNRVRISVEDNGPGIPEEIRPKIFDHYFTTKSLGTGLGLPIARKLVNLVGATIDLHHPPGSGVEAEIRLPSRTVVRQPVPERPAAAVGA
jgi:two-component system sensor histidine kinase HydH